MIAGRKKALVTGATGFVGANVARLLLERGREVRCLARPGADLRNIPTEAETVSGDLRDPESLARAAKSCDEVFHVAADYRFWAKRPQEIYDSNVQGTENLLAAAERAGAGRIVYTSTVGAIGLSAQPSPCDERTPMDPGQVTSHYKKSKIDAEAVALRFAQRGAPVVIVNPSTPIGSWDRKPTPTGKIIVDFMQGKMPAYVETGLNFIDVRDVAEGHLLAAERGVIGERYILGHQNLSMIDFLRVLSEITGRPAPRFRIPYGAAWVAGWCSTRYSDWISGQPPAVALEAVKMSRRFMFFDASKAVRELGLPQTPVKQAAEEAVKWFARRLHGDSG